MTSPRLTPDELARRAGAALPAPLLEATLGAALAGLGASLCLHRVGPRRPTDWQSGLSIEAATLDALTELLLRRRPGSAAGWLSLSFDDGYADAVEYVRTRAPRFPSVDFFLFVCPRKLERRAGFRWDLVERLLAAGTPRHEALARLDDAFSTAEENERPELRGLADDPAFALATVEELRDLARLPNVHLGNHTNLHASPRRLPDDVAARDYRESRADFERLFGPQRHFAFPFGSPRHHVEARQADLARATGPCELWSTEARPYRLEERRPGAVLPRFPVDGSKTASELAGWIAARALDFRLRRRRFDFGQP
jgi:peptidoglycan/xylan/chitin deacetylase (PgdA/CDA1 family)